MSSTLKTEEDLTLGVGGRVSRFIQGKRGLKGLRSGQGNWRTERLESMQEAGRGQRGLPSRLQQA